MFLVGHKTFLFCAQQCHLKAIDTRIFWDSGPSSTVDNKNFHTFTQLPENSDYLTVELESGLSSSIQHVCGLWGKPEYPEKEQSTKPQFTFASSKVVYVYKYGH